MLKRSYINELRNKQHSLQRLQKLIKMNTRGLVTPKGAAAMTTAVTLEALLEVWIMELEAVNGP